MTVTQTFLNFLSVGDVVLNNPGTTLGNTNAALQLAALGAGWRMAYSKSLASSFLAFETGAVAATSAIAVAQNDWTTYKSNPTTGNEDQVIADGLSVASDLLIVGSALAREANSNTLSQKLDLIGEGVGALGLGFNNAVSGSAGQKALTVILSELSGFMSDSQSALDSSGLNATTQNYFQNYLNSLASVDNNLNVMVNQAGTSAGLAAGDNENSLFNASETSTTSLFNGIGGQTENDTVNEGTGAGPTSVSDVPADGTTPSITTSISGNSSTDTSSIGAVSGSVTEGSATVETSANSVSSLEQFTAADGSGAVAANGNVISYAAGDTASASFDSSGDVVTTIQPSSGASESFTVSPTDSESFTSGSESVNLTAGSGTSTSVDANGNVTFQLGSPTENFAESVVLSPSSGTVQYDFTNSSDQTTVDSLGQIGSGGIIDVNAGDVTVSNANGQMLSNTQLINFGNGAYGPLENSWNPTNAEYTDVKVSGVNASLLFLKDDGTGLIQTAPGAALYYYQNGVETALNIPGISGQSGNVFTDDKNDIIANIAGGPQIYSGASSNYTGGTTSTLLGPNGQAALNVLAVSETGNTILMGSSGGLVAKNNNGTFTSITLPTTSPIGAGTFTIEAVNDNGQIAGYYSTGTVVNGAIYNYQTSSLTLLSGPAGSTGATLYGINNSGTVVGSYTDANSAAWAFSYSNGTYSTINIPGITPFTETIPGGGGAQAFDIMQATGITNNGEIVVKNEANANSFSGQTITESYVINPAAPVSGSMAVAGGGTVTMSSGITGVQTVNLQAAPSGQSQAAFNFTANNLAGLTISDGTATNDTLTAGSGGDTLVAGTGSDTLNGGNAYNTYKFGASFGQDVINNAAGGNTTAKGEVDFGTGLSFKNLWFTQSGNNLVISVLGTTDTVTLTGWFGANAGAQVQAIKTADGLQLSSSSVAGLVSAMATYQTNNPSFNPATATLPNNSTLLVAMVGAWYGDHYSTVTLNADGSFVGVTNDTSGLDWTSVTTNYSTTNQRVQTVELYNNGSTITTTYSQTGGYNTYAFNGTLPVDADVLTRPGNNQIIMGNVTGILLDARSTKSNNILTVQDLITNSSPSYDANYNNILSAYGSSGNNTLTVSDGSYDYLRVDTSTGNNTLTAGNGSNDRLNAQSTHGANSLSAGNGHTDTLDVSSSSGNNTLIAGNGDFEALLALNTTGNNTLTAGNGGNVLLDVAGSTGSDTLTAGNGGDTLIAGIGNDTLNGGNAYNTYQFGASFGQDTINNAAGGNTTAQGEIDFTSSSVTDESLWFVRSGNNLVIDLLGTNDQITVNNWFGTNAGADVQTFNAGGLKLDTQVAQLVQAMASYQSAHSSFNPATATAMPTDTTLQNTIAAAWHH